MNDNERNTAYCGLFCTDCIPSDRRLFEVADELSDLLRQVGFEHYAALKAKRISALEGYPTFAQVLREICSLRCAASCRDGGGNPECRVRKCALDRSYAGCWECDAFAACELLQPLRDFHGDNINHNLEMIRRHGLAKWTPYRRKHYPWS